MASKKSALYGAVVDARGHATPVVVESSSMVNIYDKAGYAPEKLDPTIKLLIDNAESGARVLQENAPLLTALMQRLQSEVAVLLQTLPKARQITDGEAPPPGMTAALEISLNLAGKISIILERLNKMTMQSVKAKDDATRLRHFLATGDDEARGGLETLSENQLRRLVTEAAQGWVKPDDNGNGGN